jgi:hypothetical protein
MFFRLMTLGDFQSVGGLGVPQLEDEDLRIDPRPSESEGILTVQWPLRAKRSGLQETRASLPRNEVVGRWETFRQMHRSASDGIS